MNQNNMKVVIGNFFVHLLSLIKKQIQVEIGDKCTKMLTSQL